MGGGQAVYETFIRILRGLSYLLGGSGMLSRFSSLLVAVSVLAGALTISGCIFPEDLVTIDIYGSDQINPNVTKPNGLRIRINNEADRDFDNMTVKITVPENIIFTGSPGGRPLKVDKGLEWMYSYQTNLKVGGVGEYSFTYQPVVYEAQFGAGNEWSFNIRVEALDSDDVSIGNQSTTWRVTR